MNIQDRIRKCELEAEKIYANPFENTKLIHDIQLEVLDIILLIEEIIISNSNRVNEIKEESKKVDKNLEERKAISSEINLLRDNNKGFKILIKSVKEIVDGIAFSIFNQSDLKMLCYKQSAGFIGGKTGIRKELEILSKVFDDDGVAILNDLTNAIRFGDITIYNNGLPNLVEIKTSNLKNKRIERQRAELEEKLHIINNDEIDNFLNLNKKFLRVYSSNPMIDYRQELINLIQRSYRDGFCHQVVEDGLHYIANYHEMHQEKFKTVIDSIENLHVYYVNGMKYGEKNNYTPFRVIFNNERIRNDFFNGEILLSVLLDVDVLLKLISDYGYRANYYENKNLEVYFVHNGEEVKMIVDSYNLFRLGREFISLKWFVSTIHDTIINIQNRIV